MLPLPLTARAMAGDDGDLFRRGRAPVVKMPRAATKTRAGDTDVLVRADLALPPSTGAPVHRRIRRIPQAAR